MFTQALALTGRRCRGCAAGAAATTRCVVQHYPSGPPAGALLGRLSLLWTRQSGARGAAAAGQMESRSAEGVVVVLGSGSSCMALASCPAYVSLHEDDVGATRSWGGRYARDMFTARRRGKNCGPPRETGAVGEVCGSVTAL